MEALEAVALALGAYIVASIPFSNLFSKRVAGVDLRNVGTGTVSGTGLYKVTGFGTLAAAGILEVGKGAAGPGVARLLDADTAMVALVAGAAVCGHNWSPFLRGAGGRGLSPAIGALAVVAWPGTALILGGLLIGRLLGDSALGTFAAFAGLVPLVAWTHGGVGLWTGVAVLLPMIAKRLMGNAPPPPPRGQTLAWRLLFDRDTLAQVP